MPDNVIWDDEVAWDDQSSPQSPPLSQLQTADPGAVFSEGGAQAQPSDPVHEAEKAQDLIGSTLQTYSPLGLVPLIGGGMAGLLSGDTASPVGIAAHLAGLDADPDDAVRNVEEALTYEPRTEEGKKFQDAIQTPFRKLGEFADAAGEYSLKHGLALPGGVFLPPGPEAATAASVAVQAVPFLFGGKKAAEVAEHPVIEAASKLAEPPSDAQAAQTLAPEIAEVSRGTDTGPAASLGTNSLDTNNVAPASGARARKERIAELEQAHDQGTLAPKDYQELANLNRDERQQAYIGNTDEPIEGVKKISARSGALPESRAFIDLDGLKEANDTYGHVVGDQLIKSLGEELGKEFPDSAFHRSGDEFVVDGPREELETKLKDLQSRFDSAPILAHAEDGTPIAQGKGVRFSYGIADAEEGLSQAALDARAEGVQYANKAIRKEQGLRTGRRSTDYESPDEIPSVSQSRETPAHTEPRPEENAAGRIQSERTGTSTEPETAGAASSPPVDRATAEGAVNDRSASPDLVREPELSADAGERGLAERDTSVRNTATYLDRVARGADDLPPVERKGWDTAKAEAAQKLAADPDYARNLAQEVVTNKRPITDSETMALGAERQRLHESYNGASDEIVRAMDAKDRTAEIAARVRRDSIEHQLDMNERATKNAGTELGRAMAARMAQATVDYSEPRNLTRIKAAFGDSFNESIRQQVKSLSDQIKAKDAEIERLQKAPPTREAPRRRTADEKMQVQLERKMGKMQEAINKRLKACPI